MKKDIKYLIMDVDGTLTNGQINIGQNGEYFKSFYCRDGLGIIKAQDSGIIPVILTSRSSNIVLERAKELKIKHIIQGMGNKKVDALKKLAEENNAIFSEIAYIGDDINDLECMHKCSLVGCPSDAVPEVKQISNYICSLPGGYGAVREFIDWLLAD